MLQIRLLAAGDSSQTARTHQKWLAQLALEHLLSLQWFIILSFIFIAIQLFISNLKSETSPLPTFILSSFASWREAFNWRSYATVSIAVQYKDDQYAPSLHVEEFDDSLLYCGTTSLVPKTILPNSSLFVPSLCQYLHLIQALIPLSSLFISSACNISMLQIRLLAAGDSSQAARTQCRVVCSN